ncbi:MAG: hypothetical protein HN683_18635 [Gammaproteobacteria bacterium]|jgi:hypothetical protein|nr:hypothetical protein [Gammaproteobacteria bacterium]
MPTLLSISQDLSGIGFWKFTGLRLALTVFGAWELINQIKKIKAGKLRGSLGVDNKKKTVWRQIEPFKFYCLLAPRIFVGLGLLAFGSAGLAFILLFLLKFIE